MGELAGRVKNAATRLARRAVLPRLSDEAWRAQALAVLATLGLMIYMVRVLGQGWPQQFTIFFPDSFSFKNAAGLTPFSPGFYAAERPIAYPTLLFLLGRSTVVTVVVQTFLYGLVYLLAAFSTSRLLQVREARPLIVFLVISIGIEPRFALWNTHVLSESLGMTLAVASVVCWWRFAAGPGRGRLHWAGVATVGWLTVRDSNVPPWLAVGVPALIIASFWWRSAEPSLRRAMRIWGLATLIVCIGVALTQSANGRNRYPTINNVGTRVLPDAELTAWFVDQGMPIDDALRQRTGADSFVNNWDMLTSPDLVRFRRWADGSGQRTMLLSYARFAPHWIRSLHHDLPVLLESNLAGYDKFGVTLRLPDPAPDQINGPTTPLGLIVWTIVAAVGIGLAAWCRRCAEAVMLALLLVSSFIDLYTAYVGDSVEVQRHMVGPLARMALIMVFCFVLGLDALVGLVRSRHTRPTS